MPSIGGTVLQRGFVGAYLSLIVLLPLAAVVAEAFSGGVGEFWTAVKDPTAVDTIKLTVGISLVVVAINAVVGTVIAWVLVRDDFRGKSVVNAIIDLPFALPTVVAGLTLIALYGNRGPAPFNVSASRWGVLIALLFVTLPFVVRAVQPVLIELDRETEEAAASLGATNGQVLRRIILPTLLPSILAGAALGFARAVGEFGSVILIAGTALGAQVTSVFIFIQIESGPDFRTKAAAVAVVLLAISLVVLLAISGISRYARRHDR